MHCLHTDKPDSSSAFFLQCLLCLLMTVAVAFSVSCSAPGGGYRDLIEDDGISTIKDWLPNPYCYQTGCVRLVQRIILHVPGMEMDMSGYLVLSEGGKWLALALGDMGVELFRFGNMGNEVRILSTPPDFPLNPLKEGVAGDIEYLFGLKRPSSVWQSAGNKSTSIRVLKYGDGDYDEFTFQSGGNRPVRSRKIRDHRVMLSVEYENYQADALRKNVVPKRILLTNHQWHYKIEITLYQVEPLSKCL